MRAIARVCLAALLVGSAARAAEPPPPPSRNSDQPNVPVLPSTHAREPEPEPDAIKLRINGEYEARQSFLTPLPLTPVAGSPAALGQRSRLFHWLRLRGLGLFGRSWELRAAADLPRGMIYGQTPVAVPDNGRDFDRPQPVRFHGRQLRVTFRGRLGEVTLGHTTTQLGLGLVDADGDQPRFFGTPDRPATYERLELLSGSAASTLRVGISTDVLFDDGRLSLASGDHLLRVALSAVVAPTRHAHLTWLARYEGLLSRAGRGGARSFLLDASGSLKSPLRGRTAALFVEYEGAYRIGDVSEPTAFGAVGTDQTLASLALAARAGIAVEREQDFRRFVQFSASLEWGMASGDADPTDELHRFVMNPNHGVGLILFDEILRYKTSRAQALLATQAPGAASARVQALPTRGGVAGATYLNPVLLLRPTADLTLKLGGLVASATTSVVDPASLVTDGHERRNFDGGSPRGRSLGTELDLGAELTLPLDAPTLLRLSVEGALAFPGSAFDAGDGRRLGTQSLTTAGLGLTF